MPPNPPGLPPGVASWPGLDSGPQTIVVGDLRVLAQRLEAYVRTLLGAASDHIKSAGSASPSAYGSWDAAGQLANTATTAHAALTDHHLRFLESMMDIVRTLDATAHIYDGHEADIEAKIKALAKELQSSAPTPALPPPGPQQQNGPVWPLAGGQQ